MKIQKVAYALIGMILLAGVASAQQVKTDYDRGTNFAQYRTYSWEHVKTKDQLDVDRIKNAVNAVLATKGWTQVDSGGQLCGGPGIREFYVFPYFLARSSV